MRDLFAMSHLMMLAFFLLIAVALLRLVIVDARQRGKSPFGVFLLVVAFFPLGLAIWLVFRPAPLELADVPSAYLGTSGAVRRS